MKLKKLLLVVFIILSVNTFGSTKEDNKSKISFLKQHYNKALILQAVDQVLEHDGFGLSIIDKEEGYDYYYYQQKAESMVRSHPNILDIAFSNVINKKESASIIEHIMNWCDIFVIIEQLPRLNTPIYLEQVLAQIPTSSIIIESFLTTEDQTWSSLSSAQLAMLPYVTANFLYKKSEVDRLQFYKDFYTKILELATADED